MIVSAIVKRKLRSNFLKMNKDDFDVDAFLAKWRDDAVWDGTSELGVGMTIKGKEAIADWFRRWKEEFPKRKFDLNNICFSSWPLSLTNVITMQWSLIQTDKQGRTFKYDGATVGHTRNYKINHVTEYISFSGLPQVSTLIGPSVKG